MASKKRKPQKLRHELSEYTSLIRTLHTTSTQDLLPHLTGSFPRPPSIPSSPHSRKHRSLSAVSHPSRSSRDSSSNAGRADDSRTGEEGDGWKNSDGTGTPKSPSSELQDNSTRDIWTRWPLLRASVYVPEWTLQDEVKSIAERAARGWLEAYADEDEAEEPPKLELSSPADTQTSPGNLSDVLESVSVDKNIPSTLPPQEPTAPIDDAMEKVLPLPEEEILTKSVLDGLYLEASTLLSQTFATLAAHRPAVDPGLQNRLRTMDWKAVFNAISSAGIIDESIMQDIHARLERVYGESDDRALERLQVRGRAKRKLQDLEESLGSRGDIFHFAHTRKGRLCFDDVCFRLTFASPYTARRRKSSKDGANQVQIKVAEDEEDGLA